MWVHDFPLPIETVPRTPHHKNTKHLSTNALGLLSHLGDPHAEAVVVGLKAVQSRGVGLVDAGDRGGGLGVLLLLVLRELEPAVLRGGIRVGPHGDQL